jgi:hypothetical protein
MQYSSGVYTEELKKHRLLFMKTIRGGQPTSGGPPFVFIVAFAISRGKKMGK